MSHWKRWLLIAVAAVINLTIVTVLLTAVDEEDTYEPPAAPFYVSLGDSYAQGFQFNGDLSNGFADQVVDGAEDRGYDFGLVNFGCGGATMASMLQVDGCIFPARDGPPYPNDTQVEAAETFLRDHRGQVELITISIGGNDVSLCATTADPLGCSGQVILQIGPMLEQIIGRLREAAGPDVPIIGLSYPNTILGRWVYPADGPDPGLALLSTEMYRQLFNPVLRTAYEAVGATFIDVTEATGGYGPLDTVTDQTPYGLIPTSVARLCEITNYCEHGDIHPNTRGYQEIAELILETLPDRR